MKFISLLKKIWPQVFLFFLVTLLVYLNFTPGTYLIGWDNLQVELDLSINLERAFNVAWQEYQGLGLLGGMGHGADLVRQIILWPLSLLLKQNLLRYFWNYLALLIGVWGAYSLFAYLIKKNTRHQLLALLGASFYLLNIGTVQNFYVTFEPFAAFFAFFPWLIYSLLNYLEKANTKNLLLFIVFSILGTIFAYVQTIFLVYLIILFVIILFFLLQKKISLKKIGLILLVIFFTNAFWLLPVAYFTIFSTSTTLKAKINLMSTEVTFLKNNQYGSFNNLATLKGFWLDYTDFDQWGNSVYLMDAWKTHFNQFWVRILSWSYFVLLVFGIMSLIFAKKSKSHLRCGHLAILTVFLFASFILAGSNPPFAFIYDFLRDSLPLFGQIFRSSFSKWIVPYSLFYSLLSTFGLAFLFSLIKKKAFQYVLSLGFFISLIFYSLPSFTGNFFYSRLRIPIPNAYFQLFNYFKNVSATSRIANLPQHSFYGWQWNDWGYRGSGFIWYGIKQPILDRAFDVWSEADERYYWQLQSALDKKDISALEKVLAQYDVDYLLLDESIINRQTVKPFNYSALKTFLLSSEKIKLTEELDFLSIYTFSEQAKSNQHNFISLYEELPLINNNYHFAWSDQAYSDFADYLTVNDQSADFVYAFPSLFTNHLQNNLEFALNDDESYFYLNNKQDIFKPEFTIYFADLLNTESQLPFHLTWSQKDNLLEIDLKLLAPEIIESQQTISFNLTKDFVFDTKLCLTKEACFININNQLISNLTEQQGEEDVLLDTKLANTIALSTNEKTKYYDYAYFDLSLYNIETTRENITGESQLKVKVPRVLLQSNIFDTELNALEPKNCRPLQGGFVVKEKRLGANYYQAVGTSVCDHFYLSDLNHDLGYLIKISTKNLTSLPAVFAIQAESVGRSPLETYLSEGINYQLLPPLEAFNQGYTLYFSTDSYGREINENLLESAEVFFWPYNFLQQLRWQRAEPKVFKNQTVDCDFVVNKKGLWLYQVDLPKNCTVRYVSLAQAYDRAWLAYQNGQQLKHRQLNNWANAWILNEQDTDTKIYIFYWPQLLEFSGLFIIGLVLLFIIIHRQKNQPKSLKEKRVE